MHSINSRIVTIVGNIGAGKSSATPLLVKLLNADTLDADNLFQTSDPFRDDYLGDIKRWSLANELWLANKRADLLNHKLKTVTKPWLVVDSGILISWAYGYTHFLSGDFSKKEWQLYDALLNKLVSNVFASTSVIKLDYSVPTLLNRIKKRGRAYEILHYTGDYLSQHEKGLTSLERRLKKLQVPLIKITEKDIPDFVGNPTDRENFLSICRQSLLSS
jgi:deoxyadenosine/deoxycytidine kinase